MAEAHPTRRVCKRYTPEQEDEMVRRYEAGETTPRIAKAMGCPTPTVWYILKRRGVKFRPSGPIPLPAEEFRRRKAERLKRWRETPEGCDFMRGWDRRKRATPEGKAQKREQAASRRLRIPEKVAAIQKKTRLLSRHKITEEEYKELLQKQGGCCAICGATRSRKKSRSLFGEERFAVDHDHADGRIRGLLCFQCNTTLGKLGDTKEAVEAWVKVVLAYLSK